jgi:hypothetical protein
MPPPDRPTTRDTEDLVHQYEQAYKHSIFKDVFTRDLHGESSKFPSTLSPAAWWQAHRLYHHECWKNFPKSWDAYRQLNHENPCYISLILAWLHHGYLPPLTEKPPSRSRDNSSTLATAPAFVRDEIKQLAAQGVVVPIDPEEAVVFSPLTIATKKMEMKKAFTALGSPDEEGQAYYYNHLDELKEDLKALHGDDAPKVKIRLCLDASQTINPFIPDLPFRQVGIMEAARLLEPGFFAAKIDLKGQFLQIASHSAASRLFCFRHEGKSWAYVTVIFGEKDGPVAANTLSGHTVSLLIERGCPATGYTDDFFVVGPTYDKCLSNRGIALSLFNEIGWVVADNKVTDPAQLITFLGVQLDSVHQTLSIEKDRLESELQSVRELLARELVSKHSIQETAGRLQWIASAMVTGRPFVSDLHTMASSFYRHGRPQPLSAEAREALLWWENKLQELVASDAPAWCRIYRTPPVAVIRSVSDASGSKGFAIICKDRVLKGEWIDPQPNDIARQELFPLFLALVEFGEQLRGHLLVFTTDNASVAFAVTKTTTHSTLLRPLLRTIMILADSLEVTAIGDHIPREINGLSDAMSKGLEYEQALRHHLRVLV